MRRFFPFAALAVATIAATPGPRLRVDPRLLIELETVRSVVARDSNPIWPGWNAKDTPVLISLPNVQEALIDHPNPPEGFVRSTGPITIPGSTILVKDGPTIVSWDGQNTSQDVNGISTLTISDSPSTLKNTLRGLLDDPRPTETKLATVEYERDLVPDLCEEMATFAHEAFHVFQSRSAPDKSPDERDIRLYPCLSVENNVGFALEARALVDAMRATTTAEARNAGLRWLAVRDQRRATLPVRAIAYEDGNEFNEGLAKYVEFALMKALEGRTPDPRLYAYQGFRGFDDLSPWRERRIESLRLNLRGEQNVNNDLYGTAPVRQRLYYSGMGIAALLDHVSPDWRTRILTPGTTLTSLAREALHATPDELSAALAAARADTGLTHLTRAKQQLAADGRRSTDSMTTSILSTRHPSVEIAYPALPAGKVGIGFTPFGVRAVDTLRTLYTMVPIQARITSRRYGFDQSTPLATYEDRESRRFVFPLSGPLDASQRRAIAAAAKADSLDLQLPGVRVFAHRATARLEGNRVRIELLP